MARRNLLHRSKLGLFLKWIGNESLPVKGDFEVARWKGNAGQPMKIIFSCGSPEHYSCNDAAVQDVLKFIREQRRPIQMPCHTP